MALPPKFQRAAIWIIVGVWLGGTALMLSQFAPQISLPSFGTVASMAVPTGGRGCPALPAREPMPRDAVAEQLENADWRQRDATLDAQLANVDRGSVRTVFVGDSITQYWDAGLFHLFYGNRAPLNLGLWGDFTQGALWRLGHDQWGSLRPKLAVVLLGTNNTQWGGTPEDVALGIAELVRFIQSRSADTKILLVGILPRGADRTEPLRAVNAKVNALISKCADNKKVFFADVGHVLLDAEGRLSDQISFDRLHLTMVGYALLGSALEPHIAPLLEK